MQGVQAFDARLTLFFLQFAYTSLEGIGPKKRKNKNSKTRQLPQLTSKGLTLYDELRRRTKPIFVSESGELKG